MEYSHRFADVAEHFEASQFVTLSVVIVTHNAKSFVLECIEALEIDLKRISHELIVVDNKSSDGTVEALMDRFPQINIVCKSTNVGFAAANNIGFKMSRGKYVCLANSDTHVLPGCFAHLLKSLDSLENTGAVGPRVLNRDGSQQISFGRFPTIFFALLEVFFLYRYAGYWRNLSRKTVDYIAGSFMIVRRDAVVNDKLFDERFFFYSEDVDFCRSINTREWRIRFEPSARVIHYGGVSSAHSPIKFYIQYIKAKLQFVYKHKKPCYFRWYALTLLFHQFVRVLLSAPLSLLPKIRGNRARALINRGKAASKFLFFALLAGSVDSASLVSSIQ